MAKMTIYVPDDLKSRMDQAEGVNWSPLACRAFEAKLSEIITKRGAKDMKDVIARLRASKESSDSADRQISRTIGRSWGMMQATAAQLGALEKVNDENYEWDTILEPPASAYSGAEALYFILSPEDDGDRDASRDFWSGYFGRPITFDNLMGFIEGALAVWEEVKDEL